MKHDHRRTERQRLVAKTLLLILLSTQSAVQAQDDQGLPTESIHFESIHSESVHSGSIRSESIPTEAIRIRDPYILADSLTRRYYLYAQMDNRRWGQEDTAQFQGVEVYVSTDLKHWESPQPVLILSDTAWARERVWAPEVHAYRDKFYLLVTLTGSDTLPPPASFNPSPGWPPLRERGTQIFVSDSPRGPFEPFANRPHTPEDWMALDGTLYEEGGDPFMIFCHEWVQTQDGSIVYVQLTEDLSGTVGPPQTMFHASEAPWVTEQGRKVTDGCFLYRTKTGKLLMIWSSNGENGYAIGIAASETGTLAGPWTQQEELLFAQNGGHGMIFKTFDQRLMLVFHQPNKPKGRERLKLFEIKDTGRSLVLSRS